MTSTDLKATLSRLGLSQAEAARLLGVTPTAVTRWVQGTRAVPGPVVRLVRLVETVPGVVEDLNANQGLDRPVSPP